MVAASAVLADHSVRHAATLDRRWAAQVEAIDAPAVDQPTGWIAAVGRREHLRRFDLLVLALGTLAALLRAGRLQTILPPPGRWWWRARSTGPAVDDPVLVKVRALLAQAESTTFEAEADAFTAKAQGLMARHSIDAAVLWAETASDERPSSIRLPVDDPYAGIKSVLLHHVAEHSRCRAVWDGLHGLATVVGFAPDLAGTELMYTSLLVQAQTALHAEGDVRRTRVQGAQPRVPLLVPVRLHAPHRPALGGGQRRRPRHRTGRAIRSRCSRCWRRGTTPSTTS